LQPEAPSADAAPGAAGHELLRFEGAVQCRAGSGAVGWSLHGMSTAMRPGLTRAIELLFSGVTAGPEQLPERLHEVRVVELEQPQRFRIEAREGRFELRAHGVQRHCDDIARPFFGALPRRRVPRLTRWGWSLLLAGLRIGPLAHWIARRGE
jgi:hypothetical protein